MKKRSLVLATIACALTMAGHNAIAKSNEPTADAISEADDKDESDGPDEIDNCLEYSSDQIKKDIIVALKKNKSCKIGSKSLTLVGEKVEKCDAKEEGSCGSGKSFVQSFEGNGYKGIASVDWFFHRAGFVTGCAVTIDSCKKEK